MQQNGQVDSCFLYIYINGSLQRIPFTRNSRESRISTKHSTLRLYGYCARIGNCHWPRPYGRKAGLRKFLGFHSKSGGRKFSWHGILRWKGHRFKSHTDVLGQYMLIFPMVLQIIAGTFCCGFRRNDISMHLDSLASSCFTFCSYTLVKSSHHFLTEYIFIIIAMPAMIDA